MIFSANIQFYINNLLPEIFLSIGILVQLIFNLSVRKSLFPNIKNLHYSIFSQSFCLILITTLLILNTNYDTLSNTTLLVSNESSKMLKMLILILSLVSLAPIAVAFEMQKLKFFEYYTIFLLSILSTILLIESNDFLSVYLLIEMQSLCFYLLATFKKDSTFSSDSGIKYFIYSSTISSILLISLSVIYGLFGTLNFSDLNVVFFVFPFSDEFSGLNTLTLISLFCVILVFLFKLGITPFHFWVIDVYEGAPLASTIIFSYLPKLALFYIILKLKFIFGSAFSEFSFFFLFCGLASVLLGAFLALVQNRMKRFLIYSSISTTGFLIVLLNYDIEMISGPTYFFIILYLITVVFSWTFFVLLYQFVEKGFLLKNFKEISTTLYLTDLKTFQGKFNLWAFLFVLALFSIAGIPPLSGFVSKFVLIAALVSEKSILVPLFLTLIGAISTFYYIKLIKIISFESKVKKDSVALYFSDLSTNFLFINCCIVFTLCMFFLLFSFFFLDIILAFSNLIAI